MEESSRIANKVAKLTPAEWTLEQTRAKRARVVAGWHNTLEEPPKDGQWVLVCSDPKWGPYNPPVSLMCFVVISKSAFVRKQFPNECDPAYLADSCLGFDGAFLTEGYEHCIVCDGPWFPDFWKPLPCTPFDRKQLRRG